MSQFRPTKVTPELFDAVKQAMANTGMTRSQIGRKFNLGYSSLQIINKCNTYADYKHFMTNQSSAKKAKKVQTSPTQDSKPEVEKKQPTQITALIFSSNDTLLDKVIKIYTTVLAIAVLLFISIVVMVFIK